VERINFCADNLGNTSLPGVQAIINRLGSEGPTLSPDRLVDGCLDMLGAYELADETRTALVAMAQEEGELRSSSDEFAPRVGQMLQSIVATTEYLFG
jgi:hypothetical protein